MFCGTRAKNFHDQQAVYMDLWGQACFEISDDKAKIALTYAQLQDPKKSLYLLGEVLDHPELYKAYPDLKNTAVFMNHRSEGNTQGVVVRANRIDGKVVSRHPDGYLSFYQTSTRKLDDLKSTVLHEVQHLINIRDDRHGLPSPFSRAIYGANFMGVGSDEADAIAARLLRYIPAAPMRVINDSLKNYRTFLSNPAEYDLPYPIQNSWLDDYDFYLANDFDGKPTDWVRTPGIEARYDEYARRAFIYGDTADILKKGAGVNPGRYDRFKTTAKTDYYLSEHEAVARDVEGRRKLNAQDRMHIRPYNAATWPPGKLEVVAPDIAEKPAVATVAPKALVDVQPLKQAITDQQSPLPKTTEVAKVATDAPTSVWKKLNPAKVRASLLAAGAVALLGVVSSFQDEPQTKQPTPGEAKPSALKSTLRL
jgi:hypothetical protein